MTQNRRTFLQSAGFMVGAAATTGASAVFAPSIARADNGFPNRAVRLVVPFTPGGGADRSMRLLAPYLEAELGQAVQVENVAGAGGWVAWSQVAAWDPEEDDHDLACVNFPHLFSYMDPRVQREETLDDFNIIAWHSTDPSVWCVREDDDRFRSLEEFLDYAIARPNELIISSTAIGSDNHISLAYAEKMIDGLQLRHAYSDGDSEKIQQILSGDSDIVSGNVGYYTQFFLEAQLRPICVMYPERWSQLPSVPTFEEVTGVRNVSFAGRTIAAAKGLAPEKEEIYRNAIEAAIANPEYIVRELENRNVLTFASGDEMNQRLSEAEQIVADSEFWQVDEG